VRKTWEMNRKIPIPIRICIIMNRSYRVAALKFNWWVHILKKERRKDKRGSIDLVTAG
jgi:hypothetical protein